MAKKISRKQRLMLECDKLVKEIVFLRDNGCVTCPIWEVLKRDADKPHKGSSVRTPGHVITRGSKSVRWELNNVHEQCSTCNFMHENYPMPFISYVVHKSGVEGFENLMRVGHKPMPSIKVFQLEILRDNLKAILKELE